ncbi:SDR family oxidoreductase [Burkholderia multivorans]|uniref:SDR family oxidoreductase n=1 Tax=Burkholderia multivorans TaxID=87883 RepID=UPI0019059A33|nr:SDR family oxidoreductase [Burkholderia multivorans]MBJ9939984.1 SDR family oxidoreductase [Burkholderia multivorans]MBU9286447.1 SDR family oxidoreductase [Burkholderia multivorans]
MKQFEGKVAIVTGGTQGLGAAIATLFAQRGARGIVFCGRSVERGEARARAIEREFGTAVTFVAADLARVEDCRAVIAAAARTFGRVDTLVNAAAMTDRGTILDTTPERFDRIFATNVRAPFFLMQETIRLMRETGTQGTIVNICSMSSKAGQPFIAAYCASKGALATLTRNTAFALLKNRIRVNALNIGWMATEGEDHIMRTYHDAKDDWLNEAAAKLPFGRLIDPREVARAVAFLAAEESGLMTGSVIDYDQSVWGGYEDAPVPHTLL